jgi:hypothetical protein
MKSKIIIVLLFRCFFSTAQTLIPIFPTNNNDGPNFGSALSLDENSVLHIANRTSIQNNNQPKVFRFTPNGSGFQQTHVLFPNDGLPSDAYGSSLDSNTAFLAIGAPFHDANGNNAGAVYVYGNDNTSNFIQKITPSDAAPNDNFGKAVVLYNDFLFIASNAVNPNNNNYNGAVYIYRWNGTSFLLLQKLQSTLVHKFGAKPYLLNQRLLLASNPTTDLSPTYSLPLTYEWNGTEWVMMNYSFTFSTSNSNLNTVVDLTMKGNQLCGIFANSNNTSGYKVCLFDLIGNTWQETATFQPFIGDYILNRIQTLNNKIVIGAIFYLFQMSRKYPVWIYSETNNAYTLENTIYGEDPELTDDSFGSTMESNASHILIGAFREFSTQSFGKAYYTNETGLNLNNTKSKDGMLYPNPASEQLQLLSTLIPNTITIYDCTGKEVLTAFHTASVSVADLSPGMYFFQAFFENGENFTSKFLKK